jgi:glycosyltransferase involved in cell wall biosynthesis
MDMMKAFLERGHEVVAVGNEAEEKWAEKFSSLNIKYRQADIQRTGTNPLKDLKTLKGLKKIIKEERPQKIFSYQAKTVIYGGIAAKRYNEIDYYPLIAGVGSVFLAKGFKAKLVRAVLKMEYKLALKGAKKVFFQNQDDVQIFLSNRLVKKSQIEMMNGSGVNLEKFCVQSLPSQPAFLCISRLIRDKGVIEYLTASKKVKEDYPNVRFLLVGPFDTNPSAITKEELDSFVNDGVVEYFGEQEDVVPYLAQCSVYVLPSYREGTPKTVLEAMASGKAIITTDAPGCRETVIDGENGYLVPVKDVDALAEKMRFFIDNPETIMEMAKKGRSMVEEKFDVKKVNASVLKTMEL